MQLRKIRFIAGMVSQNSPADTSQFVGVSHNRFVPASSFLKTNNPSPQRIFTGRRMADNSSRPMNQELSEIFIAPFADPKKDVFSSATTLSGNQDK